MSVRREAQPGSSSRTSAVGACLLTAALLSAFHAGPTAHAQEEIESTVSTISGQVSARGSGATRGIARPPASVVTPTQPATVVTQNPTTSVAIQTPTTSAGDGGSVEAIPTTVAPTVTTAGTAGSFFIPPPVTDQADEPGAATTASTVVTSAADERSTTDDTGATGWFAGANVSNGGLVPAVPTSATATPSTVVSTTMAPATTTPPVAATSPTTVEQPAGSSADPSEGAPTLSTTSDRALGRSRTSRLFEVAAVIAGVIGLSAVPVFLARMIRGKRDEQLVDDGLPA